MSRSAVVATIAVVAALTGCGGGSGDADAEDGPGPLAELMGWQPEEPAEMRRKELESEELVAECMRAEGWEYIPVDYSAQFPDTGDEDLSLMDDPEAYGEKYGYGVVRNYELYEEEGLLSGDSDRGMGMEFEDPNQDYVQSLSSSEMEEYYATLHGDPKIWGDPEAEEQDVFVSPPLDDQGCSGKARLEVYGENPMDSNPEIQERLNEFFEGSVDDPRVEAAAADWVECMGDTIAGIEVYLEPIDHPDDMWGYLDQLKMEAMGLEAQPYDESDPEAESAYMVMSSGSSPDSPSVAYVGTPEAIPEAQLEELRVRELEVWRIDFDCQDDVDFAKIRRQIEEEFVEEIRADFPELAEADDSAGDDTGS